MSVQIDRAKLSVALTDAAKIADVRGANDIGQCIRLVAVDNALTVSATDFAHWIDLEVPCAGELEAVCVHASRIAEVVSTLSGDSLNLKAEDGKLYILSGRGKRTLTTVAADQFPQPDFQANATITLSAAKLAEAIRFTLPCAALASDLAKQSISGVHLYTEEGRLLAIGTDAVTLARCEVGPCSADISATIGQKQSEFLSQLPSKEVELQFSDTAAVARWTGGSIRGPLPQSRYPLDAVRNAMGSAYLTTASLEGKELSRALRSVRPLGRDDRASKSKAVAMTLNGVGKLTASSPEGSAVEEFTVDWDGEGEFAIGLAASRVQRMLNCFGDQVLNLSFSDPSSNVKFEAAGKSDRVGLLWPMRI